MKDRKKYYIFQSETRNRIIRMNLYMEISTLGVTFAACASSIFGMNLNSGIEEDPYAFYLGPILQNFFP